MSRAKPAKIAKSKDQIDAGHGLPAQMAWWKHSESESLAVKAQRRQGYGQRTNSNKWFSPSVSELCALCVFARDTPSFVLAAKAPRLWGRIKTFINGFHPQLPNFALFAFLREILRISVAAPPRQDQFVTNRQLILYPSSFATSLAIRSSATSSKVIFLPPNCPNNCSDLTICSTPSRLGTPLPLTVF